MVITESTLYISSLFPRKRLLDSKFKERGRGERFIESVWEREIQKKLKWEKMKLREEERKCREVLYELVENILCAG